jgi:hypothetical protein
MLRGAEKKFQLNYNREIFSLMLAPTVVISKQIQRFHAKIPDPGGCFNDKANKLSSHFAGSLSTCAKIITFSSRRRVVLLMATKRPFFLSRSLPVPCVSVDGQKKSEFNFARRLRRQWVRETMQHSGSLLRPCAPSSVCRRRSRPLSRTLFSLWPRASECRRSVEWSQSIGP